jgi:hypothetical protein
MSSGLKVGGMSTSRKFGTRDNAALTLIDEEMQKVRRQFERIRQDRIEIQAQSKIVLDYVKVEGANTVWDSSKDTAPLFDMIIRSGNKNIYLLADIHYLLISLGMIGKLFKMLEKALPDAYELKAVRKNYDLIFKDYSDFRSNIEHIYDKLTPELPNHGGYNEEEYFFGDKKFKIGKQREEEIERIYSDIKAAVNAYRERTKKPPATQR